MKLYVGNLSKEMSEAEFATLVGTFGTPTSASLAKDRVTGASRGFGFVEFANADQAKAAIDALNGKEVNGRVLKVNESQPKARA